MKSGQVWFRREEDKKAWRFVLNKTFLEEKK